METKQMTPAGQRWTRSKPTQPGYWWFKSSSNQAVYMIEARTNLSGQIIIKFADAATYKLADEFELGGEWLGPISPTDRQQGRVEGLEKAAQEARFGAMELRAMNEPLETDALGYGQKALQDFADILDSLAQQAQDGKGVGDGAT